MISVIFVSVCIFRHQLLDGGDPPTALGAQSRPFHHLHGDGRRQALGRPIAWHAGRGRGGAGGGRGLQEPPGVRGRGQRGPLLLGPHSGVHRGAAGGTRA